MPSASTTSKGACLSRQYGWHRPVFVEEPRLRDAPRLSGGARHDRIAGPGMHEAFGSVYRAGFRRETHVDLALKLARRDVARIRADDLREAGLSA